MPPHMREHQPIATNSRTQSPHRSVNAAGVRPVRHIAINCLPRQLCRHLHQPSLSGRRPNAGQWHAHFSRGFSVRHGPNSPADRPTFGSPAADHALAYQPVLQYALGSRPLPASRLLRWQANSAGSTVPLSQI
ncbi:hypothetical protein [Vibrio chagasii]|uniref:hypothetical protein n=1 Tax=Vibrio chagasii TaxID=170679 RepID=UPI0021C32B5F|nr:hypothetical protein [Vibrio chagasii]